MDRTVLLAELIAALPPRTDPPPPRQHTPSEDAYSELVRLAGDTRTAVAALAKCIATNRAGYLARAIPTRAQASMDEDARDEFESSAQGLTVAALRALEAYRACLTAHKSALNVQHTVYFTGIFDLLNTHLKNSNDAFAQLRKRRTALNERRLRLTARTRQKKQVWPFAIVLRSVLEVCCIL